MSQNQHGLQYRVVWNGEVHSVYSLQRHKGRKDIQVLKYILFFISHWIYKPLFFPLSYLLLINNPKYKFTLQTVLRMRKSAIIQIVLTRWHRKLRNESGPELEL